MKQQKYMIFKRHVHPSLDTFSLRELRALGAQSRKVGPSKSNSIFDNFFGWNFKPLQYHQT